MRRKATVNQSKNRKKKYKVLQKFLMRIAFCNQHKTNNSSDWGQEGGREQWGEEWLQHGIAQLNLSEGGRGAVETIKTQMAKLKI